LKITFLGTGTSQGIPVIGSTHPVCFSDDPRDRRLRVSALIQWEGFNYVIDCGPDFRQQMLSTLSRKQESLHGILFTHEHADHVAGLDDIRPFVFRQGDIPIYGHPRVLENLKRRFDYIFTTENRYPGAPSVQTFAVRFDKIAYLTDVKTIGPSEINKLKDLDILVINALRYEEHQTHLNVAEALALIEQIQPKKAYLTHISHHMGFHEDIEKDLPDHVFPAYDGLTVTIP